MLLTAKMLAAFSLSLLPQGESAPASRPTIVLQSGQVLQRTAQDGLAVVPGVRIATAVEGDWWSVRVVDRRGGAIGEMKRVGDAGELRAALAGGPYTVLCEGRTPAGGAPLQVAPVFIGDLWVLAGQSNMEGNGYVEAEPPPPEGIMSFGAGGDLAWKPAVEPLHRFRSPGDQPGWAAVPRRAALATPVGKGAGPGLAFARALHAAEPVPIGLLPCAVGGTSLAQWAPGKRDDQRSLYGAMLARVRAAGGRVAGLVWYQGEADAVGGAETAATYGARFEGFIAAVRRDLGDPRLPFVYAQLSRYVTPKSEWAAPWNVVQEAQRVLPARVPGTACVATVDLPLDDPIHLSTDAERRLGRRLALAVAALRAGRPGLFGPQPLGAHVAGRRDVVVVDFAGLTGRLRTSPLIPADATGQSSASAERPSGFSLADHDGRPLDLIFDAALGEGGSSVVLRLSEALPAGATLWYGRGLNPYCNLVDGADLAVPVFGPLPLD